MKIIASVLLVTSALLGLAFQQTPQVKAEDLRRLTGAQWKGTLTYLDYSSNKRVSIPSNLTVKERADSEQIWDFEYDYPDEPRANSKQAVVLSKEGATIDGEIVLERTNMGDGTLRLVTERKGKDDDKEALFRYTYLIGASSFSITKEVRPAGASGFFERNQYSWKR